MLDRIDIIIEVPQIDLFDDNFQRSESSEDIKIRVLKARRLQKLRYADFAANLQNNAKIDGKTLEKHLFLSEKSQEIIKKAANSGKFSMRGISRIMRVARTIADLDESKNIEKNHILEAISYRRE